MQQNDNAYSLTEFVKKFRPDGYGHIMIEYEGETVDHIEFEEVVCDFCNASITEPDEEPDKKVVFMIADDSYAICERCYIKREVNK